MNILNMLLVGAGIYFILFLVIFSFAMYLIIAIAKKVLKPLKEEK